MRKALIAAIVASALFAVGAFAASFGVQAEDVTSGSDQVERCAERVDINFGTSYVADDNDWRIDNAQVSFLTASGVADDGCKDHDLTLQLEDEAGVTLPVNTTFTWNTARTVATFTWTGTARPLVDVVGYAALLADGFQFWADVPGPA
jgi:hypothetical protein